jgi:Mor family transcriptional regulator
MAFYGGLRVYIPLERTGFKEDISKEICEKHDGAHESMNELCRHCNLSFAQVYRCVHNAMERKRRERERKNQKELFDG